jgi:hypothetical protein
MKWMMVTLLSLFVFAQDTEQSFLPVECISNLNIDWAPAYPTTKSIQIQVSTKAQRNSWVGIGISKTGGMIGSRALVAMISGKGVVSMQEYQIFGYDKNRFLVPIISTNITSKPFNFHYNKQTTTLMFTFERDVIPKDSSIVPIFTNGTSNYLMCARGLLTENQTLGYHFERNTIQVQFNANY